MQDFSQALLEARTTSKISQRTHLLFAPVGVSLSGFEVAFF